MIRLQTGYFLRYIAKPFVSVTCRRCPWCASIRKHEPGDKMGLHTVAITCTACQQNAITGARRSCMPKGWKCCMPVLYCSGATSPSTGGGGSSTDTFAAESPSTGAGYMTDNFAATTPRTGVGNTKDTFVATASSSGADLHFSIKGHWQKQTRKKETRLVQAIRTTKVGAGLTEGPRTSHVCRHC